MREIKFRAWDKKSITMDYFDLMDLVQPASDSLIYSSGVASPEKKEIMQFTGLKDKNGREIYEGDILLGTWGHFDEPRHYEVKWADDMAGFDPFVCYSDAEEFDTKNCEVVGNIYKNPELLK